LLIANEIRYIKFSTKGPEKIDQYLYHENLKLLH